jgi:hypothetical protein
VPGAFRTALVAAVLVVAAVPASAVLDVENRGPTLTAGAFAMRLTNIGVTGNPFQDIGRSFDPSFEFPRGSGQEMLKHADLWVGATDASGIRRVSGGPILEWRPTLDPDDHVRVAYGGDLGTLRFVDDDGDGRVDEEFLDGKDDDGDGEVDEDLGLFATQTLFARYTDDQPEAVEFGYLNGEPHVPLHLDVKQEAFAWAIPGFDHVAGLRFVITNKGAQALTEVRFGFLADLDAREAGSVGGHVDDLARSVAYQEMFNDGVSSVPSVLTRFPGADPLPWFTYCTPTETGVCPAVVDSRTASGLGGIAVVPLWHTIDPLGYLPLQGRVSDAIVRPFIRAPLHVAFRSKWFANDLPPGQGGLPLLDTDRYRALAGEYPGVADTTRPHDYVTLVTCGPFVRLDPGGSIEVDLALVAATPDSLGAAVAHAVEAHHGGYANALPDTSVRAWGEWSVGRSGITGHETCYEPPEGLEFEMDPHCIRKFLPSSIDAAPSSAQYGHGRCIWTDMDCDACTGFDGKETFSQWRDPAGAPAPPAWRARPADGSITVEWDDRSEILLDAHVAAGTNVRFIGYNLYRLDDWRSRRADVPQPTQFQQVASFASDTTLGARSLASITDTTLDYTRIVLERPVHPIGRYRWKDTRVHNGFDYIYVVTAVSERTLQVLSGIPITERLESPFLANLDSVATPAITAPAAPSRVWVVPNPYRAHAPWDRPPVPGDVFARHVDFMGLPRARSVIRIYTMAGDLVARVDHDGSSGSGQARWDLISRNGQDVASGVYLFTVEAPGLHDVGRFVVLR